MSVRAPVTGSTARRIYRVLALATLALLCASQSAGAATPRGATFTPTGNCGSGLTLFQTVSSGSLYAMPSPGVITTWAFASSATNVPQVKLKIGRTLAANSFFIVGDSELETPGPSSLNTYDTRVPVQAGDLLGLFVTNGNCQIPAPGTHTLRFHNGDPAPGSTFMTFAAEAFQLDVAAILEPDGDGDGFGDETQDCNPANAAQTTDCAPPETTITAGPKDKTKKKTATFAFAGADARAVAGFECSLDGAAFTSCSSPFTVKVKRGKHTFSVRAADTAGNVEATPATDDWKVKRKRK